MVVGCYPLCCLTGGLGTGISVCLPCVGLALRPQQGWGALVAP